jgi:hypothetical protein
MTDRDPLERLIGIVGIAHTSEPGSLKKTEIAAKYAAVAGVSVAAVPRERCVT